jgi:hypothetical protein
MLLFRLCACANAGRGAACTALASPFSDPSAVRLEPCVVGDSGGMAPAAVSPNRGAFAATASIRGAFARASAPRAGPGDAGGGASVGVLAAAATLAGADDVSSGSVVVDVDRLLDDDGSFGAEKVLDTAETTDSCELGTSGLDAALSGCVGMVLAFSDGAIDKYVVCSRADAPTYAVPSRRGKMRLALGTTSDSSYGGDQKASIARWSLCRRLRRRQQSEPAGINDKEGRGRVSRACDANGGYQPKPLPKPNVICYGRTEAQKIGQRLGEARDTRRAGREEGVETVCTRSSLLVLSWSRARSCASALAGGNRIWTLNTHTTSTEIGVKRCMSPD